MPLAEGQDAHQLLSAARDLVRVDDERTAGLWPRAAALLGRQAIEMSMQTLWERRAPGLGATSGRCQLLCLREFLRDVELAGRVSTTWAGLSRACHVRVYEVAPTAEELDLWLQCAWELAEAVARECRVA